MSGILLSSVGASYKSDPAIGSAFGGGYYAGKISTTGNGVATHYLIVAPKSTGQSTKQWKTTDTYTAGTFSTIDGPTNSANMNNASHPAAQFCEGLTIGGYSDWYMPARDELEVCYYFLKPTTDTNNTSYGANSYAVSPQPRNTNYTSGSPAQTSASLFKTGQSEAFDAADYWSSTGDGVNGISLWFVQGDWGYATKTSSFGVRAVRRVPI